MKLSQLTQSTIQARDLIEVTKAHFDDARLDLISWISPSGDFYIDKKSTIEEIISSGSWR